MKKATIFIIVCIVLATTSIVYAQQNTGTKTPPQLQQKLQSLEEKIDALEEYIKIIQKNQIQILNEINTCKIRARR